MGSDNYVVIQGWMCSELGLKGNDLLVFALIHGFSQDGESRFTGSRKYIAETFNISLPTVDRAINNLLEKNLIEQHKINNNGVVFNQYNSLYPIKKLYRGSKESLHNKSNNINIDIGNSIFDKSNIELHAEPEFTFGKPKQKRNGLYDQCKSLIYEFTDNREIQKLLFEYLNFRITIKDKPLYANMWKGMLRKLKDIPDMQAAIKYSIERGYLSFYAAPRQTTDRPSFDPAKFETYTEAEKEQFNQDIEDMKAKGLRVEF